MTESDIANLSLAGKLGGDSIKDINGTDKISSLCRIQLPVCRKKAITDLASLGCPFRETVRYADLGNKLASDKLPEIGGWEYAFNLPGDCLAMVRQLDEDFTSNTAKRTEYRYETIANKDGNGKLFLTNDFSNSAGTSAFIEYSIDIPNPAGFSQVLIDCIVYSLAAELCPLIGKDTKFADNLLLKYEQIAIPKAKKYNQSQINNYAKETPPNFLGGR